MTVAGDAVIIGAGQAGLTLAVALRERGWEGGIQLVGEEGRLPYQRPPLSKGYLSGRENAEDLLLRSADALARDRITTHLGRRVAAVDREARRVELDDGGALEYGALVFATGSVPRRLDVPGGELDGVHALRTAEDADALREDLAVGGDTVFIGGGFLNLEVAVEAARHGQATVLEVAPQVLGRVLSRETATALARYHAEQGIEIRCGVEIVALVGDGGRVAAVELADGSRIPATRVVLSVGAVARDELAAAAGLETAGGIVVDAELRTGDDRVFAIGDCARYPSPFSGTSMRVESVQNATDHARHVAAVLTGGAGGEYRAVPWFWSTQGRRRLQIAGIAMPSDEARLVERAENGTLVVERLRGGALVAVETINAPAAHMRARRALAAVGAA